MVLDQHDRAHLRISNDPYDIHEGQLSNRSPYLSQVSSHQLYWNTFCPYCIATSLVNLNLYQNEPKLTNTKIIFTFLMVCMHIYVYRYHLGQCSHWFDMKSHLSSCLQCVGGCFIWAFSKKGTPDLDKYPLS